MAYDKNPTIVNLQCICLGLYLLWVDFINYLSDFGVSVITSIPLPSHMRYILHTRNEKPLNSNYCESKQRMTALEIEQAPLMEVILRQALRHFSNWRCCCGPVHPKDITAHRRESQSLHFIPRLQCCIEGLDMRHVHRDSAYTIPETLVFNPAILPPPRFNLVIHSCLIWLREKIRANRESA